MARIPIIEYRIKNVPFSLDSAFLSPIALFLDVYLTIALPKPKSKMLKYAAIDPIIAYKPYSDWPSNRIINGVYNKAIRMDINIDT